MIPIKEKFKQAVPQLEKDLGRKNALALPRLSRVVVSARVGKRRDKAHQELVADRLMKITGQKPAATIARQSIASFKLRQGERIGWKVTLRGVRMYDFLDRFLNVAVPRMRDFRGFDEKSISTGGVLNLGVREHIIFPETADEELKDVFGFAVTIVTTATTRAEALALFRALGFPFKKTA